MSTVSCGWLAWKAAAKAVPLAAVNAPYTVALPLACVAELPLLGGGELAPPAELAPADEVCGAAGVELVVLACFELLHAATVKTVATAMPAAIARFIASSHHLVRASAFCGADR
jgi:hypothetical protein